MGTVGGVALLAILLVGAFLVSAAGGAGDRIEWFSTYALILGLPTSYLFSALMQAAPDIPGASASVTLAIALVCNWALVGALFGLVVGRFRRAT